MLQLLLEGGEDYGDLAVLLGVPDEEVRVRAVSALEALGGKEFDQSLPTGDYLLGQMDADQTEAVITELAQRPSELAQARRLHARLRLLYPDATLPTLPSAGGTAVATPAPAPAPADPAPAPEREPESPPAPTPVDPEPIPAPADTAEQDPKPEPELSQPGPVEPVEPTLAPAEPVGTDKSEATANEPQGTRPSLTSQQKRLLALLSALGLAVVMTVLGISGAFGGGDSNGEDSGSDAPETTAQSSDTQLTRAVLQAQDGSEASGVAIFGAVDEQTPVLQVTAENLRPTKDGEEYSVWLDGEVPAALRLAGVEVNRNGQIATQIQLPTEVLNFVVEGGFDQIDISLNRKRAYRQEMRAAERQERPTRRIGSSVLRGPITGPGIGAAGGDQ